MNTFTKANVQTLNNWIAENSADSNEADVTQELLNRNSVKELMDNFDTVKKEIDGNNRYYSKSRDDYESATTDLNLCKTQGFSDAVILVFKDCIETTLEQTLKSFK